MLLLLCGHTLGFVNIIIFVIIITICVMQRGGVEVCKGRETVGLGVM